MHNFSRGQRNGLIVLSFLIVISLFIPKIYKAFYKKDYSISFASFEQEIESAKKANPKQSVHKDKSHLFNFNPNTATKSDFIRLDLTDRQIDQILNYRNKNGYFYSKSDFSKIYAIDSTTYRRLESFISIPEKQKKKYTKKFKNQKYKKKDIAKVSIEINTASSLQLQQIYGLWPNLADRIIKYRKALGGFVKKKQLLEVYGIKPEKYQEIEIQMTINRSMIKRINVNFASAQDLEKHPYIGSKKAKDIVKDKTFNGRYTSLNNLQKRMKWDNAYTEKLKPYLQF